MARPIPTRTWLLPLIVVATVLAIGLVATWLLWAELPTQVAVHWGADGTADDFSSKTEALIWAVAITTLLPIVLLALGAGIRQLAALVPVAAGIAAFLGLLSFGSLLSQRASTAAPPGPPVLISLLLGVVVSGLIALAAPRRRAIVVPEYLSAAEAESQLWRARTRVARSALVSLGVVTAAALALTGWLAVLGSWELAGCVALVAALVGSLALGMRADVVIDQQGLAVLVFGGWRWLGVSIQDVAQASVVEVHPLGEFGGYGLRGGFDGSRAMVTSAGPALKVERNDEPPVYVTVEDPQAGAALLNRLADRYRATAP